ncbi:APC family permease [Paenibacillus chungangensis]|uniref:APC family permease n=1 Tax=Paenibacillus chungangensis TaxID=696535 RepID=A0ABW3HNA7_9BACL
MASALVGFLLHAALFLFIIVIAVRGSMAVARHPTYQSMLRFGVETQLLQDRNELSQYGMIGILRRQLRTVSSMGLSFNTMAFLGTAVIVYGPSIGTGGLSVIGYGLPVVALLSIALGATLAELASETPTAGGVYHAAYASGGERAASATGLLLLMGHIAKLTLLAGAFAYLANDYLAARFSFTATSVSYWICYLLVTTSLATVQQVASRSLRWLLSAGVSLQVLAASAMLASLVFLFWPGEYSPAILYQWNDAALTGNVTMSTFLTGSLLLLLLFLGMDGSGLGAEECIEPRVHVPWAIFLSVAYSSLLVGVLLFFLSLLWNPGGDMPLDQGFGGSEVFLDTVGSERGRGWWLPLILVALWLSCYSSLTASARALFSMARDGIFPIGQKLAIVSLRSALPLYAIWACAATVIIVMAVLQSLYERAVLLPLTSIATVCLLGAYGIALSCRAWRRQGAKGNDGPWHLGSWSGPVRHIAICWIAATVLLASILLDPIGPATGILLIAVSWLTARRLRMQLRRKRRGK